MASGKKLKELIKKKNVSVAELSRKTKIPAQTLYATIKRDSNLYVDTLQKIATALNISISELTGEIGEHKPKTNFDMCCQSIENMAQVIDIAKIGWTKEQIIDWLKTEVQ